MNPDDYQLLAKRTECDQSEAKKRYENYAMVRMNHSVMGLTGEVGEMAGALERALHYGQSFNLPNFVEEIGDCLWYLALACNACGVQMSDVMNANIEKLRQRYPEKFDGNKALEENRDRAKEAEIIIKEVAGGQVTTVVEQVSVLEHAVADGVQLEVGVEDVADPLAMSFAPEVVGVEGVCFDTTTARRLSRNNKWICAKCGYHINDEIVYRMLAALENQGAKMCAGCLSPLTVKDLVCLN